MSNAAMGQKPPVQWMQLFLNEPLAQVLGSALGLKYAEGSQLGAVLKNAQGCGQGPSRLLKNPQLAQDSR